MFYGQGYGLNRCMSDAITHTIDVTYWTLCDIDDQESATPIKSYKSFRVSMCFFLETQTGCHGNDRKICSEILKRKYVWRVQQTEDVAHAWLVKLAKGEAQLAGTR
jgi:hypothetical protein